MGGGGGERGVRRGKGREGREGAKRDVHSPSASGELKEGKEIGPGYLTLLKVLRRGLQFALLTGRGLLLQVLEGRKRNQSDWLRLHGRTPGVVQCEDACLYLSGFAF